MTGEKKRRPHADYLGWHLKMSVNERQNERHERERRKGKARRVPRPEPSRPAPRRRRNADLSSCAELGWVAARHVEPLVGLEGVDGRDLVRHEAAVQLAPRGPQAGLLVELVAVALLDGDLFHTENVSTPGSK